MLTIPEMKELMRKHPDLKQEFEAEWTRALSMGRNPRDKAVMTSKEMEQQLKSLTQLFEIKGKYGVPEKVTAALTRKRGGFCSSCGSKTTYGFSFCQNCGAKIR